MMISTLHGNVRYTYVQPKLPWYRRLLGQKYGPGWNIDVSDGNDVWLSDTIEQSPDPALVMTVLLKLLDERDEDYNR